MKLYEHQVEALDLIKDRNRCAIYYDMGLGKTFIGSEKMKQLGAKINLVICQKSKVNDWFNHFETYYPWSNVYDLTKKSDFECFMHDKPKCPLAMVGIINYDLVWRRPGLLKLSDFTLMLDESSLITNRTANRSKFILKMNPENVILLSGTPTAGKYEKLWSQLKLLGWNISEDIFWKSYVDYEWVDRNGFWDKQVNGYKNVEHLKKRLGEFGAIFKKTNEVMDLPEQIDQMIYVEQSKEYKKFKKDRVITLNTYRNQYCEYGGDESDFYGKDVTPTITLVGDNSLTKILYERQLCGQYSQAKLEAFKDLVESTEDRLIVFYNFTAELARMAEIVYDHRPISMVNGAGRELKNYDDCDNSITFVQYQAGAYGLNLQKANKVVYYSLPLGIGSCDLWEQSKKRIHRIGQDKTCFYYYLLVKNSIETWNLELLKTGKELTDDLFTKEINDL